jgi:hypothetical protein
LYGLYHNAVSIYTVQRRTAGNLINDELERILLEEVLVYQRYYPGISLQELSKLTETLRTDGVPSEVRTEHIRDTYLGHYRYVNMPGLFIITPSG